VFLFEEVASTIHATPSTPRDDHDNDEMVFQVLTDAPSNARVFQQAKDRKIWLARVVPGML
jgi:hypothetical protein